MNKDEKATKRLYKNIADFYHNYRTANTSFFNEKIEMPAMINVLGNLKNKKILDWGCGSGLYIKKIKSKCKQIKGFDISPEMVEIAKKLNPKIEIKVGSGTKIPFREKFDIVYASLSIHYLKDLNPVFKELKRVVKPNGYFVFSTGNILRKAAKSIKINGKKYRVLGLRDYFNLKKTKEIIEVNGKKRIFFNYVIKPKQVIQMANKYGFEIVDYEDCKPIPSGKKLDPEHYKIYTKSKCFCKKRLF